MSDSVVGVWKLVAYYIEDVNTGDRQEHFGPNPRGTLILHPGGRMAVLIAPRDRTQPASEAEQAAAFRTLLAYSGQYRLEAPDRFVTSVDIASFPMWVDTEQARTYSLDGDRLNLFTAPGRMPRENSEGATCRAVLSWVREA